MSIKSVLKTTLSEEQVKRFKSLREYSPKELKKDLEACRKLSDLRKKSKGKSDRIRVGFIVQMAEIWDKESPIYDAMVNDERFEPELIVVPPYDQINEVVTTSYENNYFLRVYPDAIKAYDNGKWIELKDWSYDYIFLQRPYDHYLPEGFRSYNIIDYAKTCYVPYGYNGSDVFNPGSTNKAFFRNIYFAFMESDYMAELLRKQFIFTIEKKTHKILSVGYPALEPKNNSSIATQIKKVLWTPRWSWNPLLGGSNFIKYKNLFIEMIEAYPDLIFVFRPHPLMFDEIRRTGLMTQAEIDDYLGKINVYGVAYDVNTPLEEAIQDADLLITDYSSIIIHASAEGKPIIYCESGIELNEPFQEIAEFMYIARTSDEVKRYFSLLINGCDPLKEKREEAVYQLMSKHKSATNNILMEIKKDYQNSQKCT